MIEYWKPNARDHIELLVAGLALLQLAGCIGTGPPPDGVQTGSGAAQPFSYPDARRAPVVDEYHGTHVADPYRWLETLDSDETTAWIATQNALAEP